MPQTPVISAPIDHARPRKAVEEGPDRASPSCPSDPPGHDARERSQETLKCLAPPRTQYQVQVGADVGKVIDSDFEPTGHPPQHLAHGSIMFAQRPRPSGTMARENEVHGASCAHRSLELALASANVAAVLRSRELDLRRTIEERQLHERRL
jgi:hypothetical protein